MKNVSTRSQDSAQNLCPVCNHPMPQPEDMPTTKSGSAFHINRTRDLLKRFEKMVLLEDSELVSLYRDENGSFVRHDKVSSIITVWFPDTQK